MVSRYKTFFCFFMMAVIFTLTGCGTQGENAINESEKTSNYASVCYRKTNCDHNHGE